MTSGLFLAQPYGNYASEQAVFAPPAPAAGQAFQQQLGGSFIHRLVAVNFTLATSAVAANRYCTVQVIGGDNLPFVVNGAAVTVSANSTQRFQGSINIATGSWAANTDVFFPLTPAFLFGSNLLRIDVANIDAGDQLSAIHVVWDRFFEAMPEGGGQPGVATAQPG